MGSFLPFNASGEAIMAWLTKMRQRIWVQSILYEWQNILLLQDTTKHAFVNTYKIIHTFFNQYSVKK